MDELVDGVMRFQDDVFPKQRHVYRKLAREGQAPKTLVISCSDSRVVPEIITQSGPGDIFVTRNAGNIVPAFSNDDVSGVTSAIEYAVVGLGVSDIVVCGHTECGAMKGLLHPELLADMPNVARWLGHCRCAHDSSPTHREGQSPADRLREVAMENVATQLTHLRTHPCVAAHVAAGKLALHGWLFDIERGTLSAMDGETGSFEPIGSEDAFAIAVPRHRPAAAPSLAATR